MTDYSPDFEELWQAYPKRNGQKRGKKPSFVIWQKMSASDRKLALVDVQKRNRNRGWGKYIKDCERYLKHCGWEDEWEPYVSDDDSKPNSGPYVPPPKEQRREVPWWETMINRIARSYMMVAGGLPETDTALRVKREIAGEAVPAFLEDIQTGLAERSSIAVELADLFLTRLDAEYGLSLKERVWTLSKKST